YEQGGRRVDVAAGRRRGDVDFDDAGAVRSDGTVGKTDRAAAGGRRERRRAAAAGSRATGRGDSHSPRQRIGKVVAAEYTGIGVGQRYRQRGDTIDRRGVGTERLADVGAARIDDVADARTGREVGVVVEAAAGKI